MFVVFWTMRTDDPKVFYDSFVICEDEERATAFLEEVMERDALYCAGMGPITNSTEHWHVRH